MECGCQTALHHGSTPRSTGRSPPCNRCQVVIESVLPPETQATGGSSTVSQVECPLHSQAQPQGSPRGTVSSLMAPVRTRPRGTSDPGPRRPVCLPTSDPRYQPTPSASTTTTPDTGKDTGTPSILLSPHVGDTTRDASTASRWLFAVAVALALGVLGASLGVEGLVEG